MKITKIKNVFKIKKSILIQSYLNAIDNKNINEIKQLTIKNNKNKNEKDIDIVYRMYNNYQLNNERLLFIIENCTSYLNISSCLIKKLMKDNNKELLGIIFEKHLKFFDNEIIINLLVLYKNKIPISNSDLYKQIDNDKYKLSTELKGYFEENASTYYLFNACLLGNVFMVKYLVERGADINKVDNEGKPPLFYACYSENENIVRYLVRLGADINKIDNKGKTPLFDTYYGGNVNIVRYLVEHGADINKENKDGETLLFDACYDGNINIVKYLVEHGANISKENKDGKTPLFDACYYGYENMVKYLVEHGADIKKKDNYGKTPLSNARYGGNENIVKYLVKNGADINENRISRATKKSWRYGIIMTH